MVLNYSSSDFWWCDQSTDVFCIDEFVLLRVDHMFVPDSEFCYTSYCICARYEIFTASCCGQKNLYMVSKVADFVGSRVVI